MIHPYVEERLGRERLAMLRQEAQHERLVREAMASGSGSHGSPGRVRVALGETLIRLGFWLGAPERRRPAAVRFYGE